MPFDQSTVLSGPTFLVDPDAVELDVSWTTSSPEGTLWQVYVDGHLTFTGTDLHCSLPYPGGSRKIEVQVGTVLPTEASVDFSASLVPGFTSSGDRARLEWDGGLYLAPDTVEFRVTGSAVAGGAVVESTILAVVSVAIGDAPLDGYGMGGYGMGGYGAAAVHYTWVSEALGPGAWTFNVRAYDAAGNPSTVQTVVFTSVAPPNAPAVFSDGKRLHASTVARVVTLTWNASP